MHEACLKVISDCIHLQQTPMCVTGLYPSPSCVRWEVWFEGRRMSTESNAPREAVGAANRYC